MKRPGSPYDPLQIEPHHPDDLTSIVVGVKDCLTLTGNAVEGNRYSVYRHPSGRIHDGQFGARFVPGQMSEWVTPVSLCNSRERRIFAESPFTICGPAV